MNAVLLLNISYEPMEIISLHRAMSLMLRDKVEAATGDTIRVTGQSNTLKIPTVIRLRRYVNVPCRSVHWSHRAVLQRDGYQCIYCGLKIGDYQRGQMLTQHSFTIDHILPRSRGGRNTWGNTACACSVCNNRKGDRTPHEVGMTLRWEPKIPRIDYVVASGDLPATWKVYLEIPHLANG